MPRLPIGRRAGLSPVTAGSALVAAMAVPASAAGGKVSVSLGEPLLTAKRHIITDPVDGHCYRDSCRKPRRSRRG
ncbi:hypothetical protein FHS34_001780 [Streptomyces echinatus]|uniref:Uncharacterized protein n=1 Tax=Streptomyces echinatus TaxID=67293 RepID=A0A7W9UQB3_9ACTN|nr:hypothetical protein [Streptomyces echinatus]